MKKPFDLPPSSLQEIPSSLCHAKRLRLFVKRDDLLHQIVSGNKWRKLCYNLSLAKAEGKEYLVTFGGAYSNHIHAVAAAGHLLGFKTVGLIRGEEPSQYGATLAFAKSKGMSFHFLSRSAYRAKEIPQELDLTSSYILPEGGTNELAIQGCGDILKELTPQMKGDVGQRYYCIPCGTGGTIAGLIEASEGQGYVLGFSALKGDFLEKEVVALQQKYHLSERSNWAINGDYHFGGYAKFNPALVDFIKSFFEETGIALDPIYTGKMAYGILDLIKKNYFPEGSTIVMIHTGGLQGIVGFNERFDLDLPGGVM